MISSNSKIKLFNAFSQNGMFPIRGWDLRAKLYRCREVCSVIHPADAPPEAEVENNFKKKNDFLSLDDVLWMRNVSER